jgi:hypothetical protein
MCWISEFLDSKPEILSGTLFLEPPLSIPAIIGQENKLHIDNREETEQIIPKLGN